MTRLKLKGSFARKSILALSALAGLAAVPASALADRDKHDLGGRHDRGNRYEHRDDRTDFSFGLRIGGPAICPPAYEQREVRVWVEPVYRTVCDRVWVEPVYRQECERVFVPDRYEVRDVIRYECGRRVIRQERVLVERGHWEDQTRRVLVCEGHWKTIERQELVSPGHWETHVQRVAIDDGRWDDGRRVAFFAHVGTR